MKFALNENGDRIIPSYSGQRAICPICSGTLLAKCGEIYIWHWQHDHDRNCDPWQEHETAWHREWKAKFPISCQEVIIEKNGERHIADVKTEQGIIIEFQNSSISKSTIRIREEFYQSMMWVVNAIEFKNNFKIRSAVTSSLRNIESSFSSQIYEFEQECKNELKRIDESILKAGGQIETVLSSITINENIIEKLGVKLAIIDEFTFALINSWVSGSYFWEPVIYDLQTEMEEKYKSQIKELSKSLESHSALIKHKEIVLLSIDKLVNFSIENRQYKFVGYSSISSRNFSKTRVILKTERDSLFPNIEKINSETEFLGYAYKQNTYDFLFDPEDKIRILTTDIEKLKNEISSAASAKAKLTDDVKAHFITLISAKISKLKVDREKLKLQYAEFIDHEAAIVRRKEKAISANKKEMEELQSDIIKEKQAARSKIMNKKKGLYTFQWLHERKSWAESAKPLYFDIGEDYLFERIGNGLFKKIILIDFLNMNKLEKPLI
jgi:competence CoiA-like predicted nuclease